MKTFVSAVCIGLSLGIGSVSFGQITGHLTIKGPVPEMKPIDLNNNPQCKGEHKEPVLDPSIVADAKGNLANVVISIETPAGQVLGNAINKPAVLDQKGCVYEPHVLAVMMNQPVVVKNSDAFMHNVHMLPINNNPLNFAQPNVGQRELKQGFVPETFRVKCDVHPWMYAWIVVTDNPYFAVSDKAGAYSIDTNGLPNGEYTFVAWQEKLGTQKQKVKVTNGKAEVNFEFEIAAK